MMRSYLLAGFLTALSCPTYGLQTNYKIKQPIGGSDYSLLHGVEDARSVKFGNPTGDQSESWNFDTEGFNNDEAVITPLNSAETLICEEGVICKLDPEGLKKPFIVTKVDKEQPIFTIQDVESSLYVSRKEDLHLELSEFQSDAMYFTLEEIKGDS